MHLLGLFLAAWLVLGIVTIFFLFWLCKRTAQRANTLGRPVLDRDEFQQLLAAANTLQEQSHFPVEETRAESSRAVSVRLKSLPIANSDVDILPSRNDSIVPNPHGRLIRSDEFFWKIATAVAMAAVIALLLVTSLDRLSPLPAGLELVHQEAPSHKIPPQISPASAKTSKMQPQITTTENSAVVNKPGKSAAAAAHKRIMNRARHSIYESEAGLVAPDTVMRYGRRAAAQ
jgi:hypothetical protein